MNLKDAFAFMGELYALHGILSTCFFGFFRILLTVVENCSGLWYNTWEFQ